MEQNLYTTAHALTDTAVSRNLSVSFKKKSPENAT
jgi:hypothetical protein